MRALLKFFVADDGQATVELAVIMPVVIVVGLIICNLGFYIERCATFDRVAEDMVLAHGVSPAQEQTLASAITEVKASIAEAMNEDISNIEVDIEKPTIQDGGVFALSPFRVKFICTMALHPALQVLRIGNVSAQSPLILKHSRTVVVDVGAMALGR